MISSYFKKRVSQRLQRFDLELDAIFISVFINRTTWNLVAHAHLYTENMEADKGECAWHSNKICEQMHFYNNYNNNNLLLILYTRRMGINCERPIIVHCDF